MPFIKGQVSPMKGKKHSQESRNKISISLKGKDPINRVSLYTPEINERRRQAMLGFKRTDKEKELARLKMIGEKNPMYGLKGELHPNWKGTTPANTLMRNSVEYKEWRSQVFQRDDYRCLDCGERGGDLQADHIYPFATYPRLRLDINNGQTLCVPCHRKTPTYGGNTITKTNG